MSGFLKERIANRRQVRRAKKIAAVDQNRGKRLVIAWILFILAIVFIAAECVGVFIAKQEYDRRRADELSANIVSDLAIMLAALQTGNQALFDQNFNEYRIDLGQLNANNYARQHESDKLSQLNEYEKTLTNNAQVIQELNQLHSMLIQLNLIASADDIVEDITSYRQNLIKLEENVEKLKSAQLAEDKQILLETTNKLETQLESISICVNVCPSSTIGEKKNQFITTITDANAKLNSINETLVEQYSPHRYILLLQ